MSRFDVYNFLFEQMEQEETRQPEEMPQQQMQPPTAEMPEKTPSQNVGETPENRTAFGEILGGTISDVSFEPVGNAGGQIKIRTSASHTPLIISWVGQKVTVTQPDGEVVMLSQGE